MSHYRSRVGVTQAEVNRLAKAAAKYGVPVTVESIAPDGTKTIVTAGKAGEQNGDEPDGGSPNPWDGVLVDATEQKRPS